MGQVGAFRYAVSIAQEPTVDPYVGMAELYFPDANSLRDYVERYESDGIEQYFDSDAQLIFRSTTEMVGIARTAGGEGHLVSAHEVVSLTSRY